MSKPWLRPLHMRDRDGEIITRAATMNSYNPATREFEAVVASDAVIRGVRIDIPSAVIPQRLPLNTDHSRSLRDQCGDMRDRRIENGGVIMRGQIFPGSRFDWLHERMQVQPLPGVSIAFTAPRMRDGTDERGNRIRIAEGAVFRHVALVTEPADDRSGIRSQDDDDDRDRDDDHRDDDDRDRNRRVRGLCRTLGLSRQVEDEAIDRRWSDSQILDRVVARGRGSDIRVGGQRTLDDPQQYRDALVEGLAARIVGAEPQGMARDAVAGSWAELHRRHLRRSGQSVTGLSDVEVLQRALSTSDMPIIAGAAVNIAIRRTYDAAVSPILGVFGTRELPDFRPQIEALVDWTTLAVSKVNELGEFRSSYVTESGETVSLYTVGGSAP
jgi:hypothetical protein